MKQLSLLLWVTQLGFSVLFPVCAFLLLGTWLQERFSLGSWVLAVCGIVGFLTSVRTAWACVRALRKETERAPKNPNIRPPAAFNDHD